MELVIALVAPVLAFLAAGAARRLTYLARLRSDLAEDAAILEKLPRGSGRDAFAEHVAAAALHLAEESTQGKAEARRRATLRQQSVWGVAVLASSVALFVSGVSEGLGVAFAPVGLALLTVSGVEWVRLRAARLERRVGPTPLGDPP